MKRYCLALDLKDDSRLIQEYEAMHEKVWPQIIQSIRDAGIEQMEIYRFHTRLCMVMEVNDNFSFERKARMDSQNEKVQEWEQLMWQYQQSIPGARKGQKWVLMDKIFSLR